MEMESQTSNHDRAAAVPGVLHLQGLVVGLVVFTPHPLIDEHLLKLRFDPCQGREPWEGSRLAGPKLKAPEQGCRRCQVSRIHGWSWPFPQRLLLPVRLLPKGSTHLIQNTELQNEESSKQFDLGWLKQQKLLGGKKNLSVKMTCQQ